MAVVFQDGFDHYGDDAAEGNDAAKTRALGYGWAQFSGSSVNIGAPDGNEFAPPEARTGYGAMMVQPTSAAPTGARLVLPDSYTTLYTHFALFLEQQPDGSGFARIFECKDVSNNTIFRVDVLPTGALVIVNEAGTTLETTGALTITTGTWHYLQIALVKHGSTGSFRLLVDEVEIVNLTNVNTGASAIAQLQWRSSGTNADPGRYWIDDLVINDDSGTYNTGLLGNLRVATLYPRADDEQGWTANRRHKFGNGICQFDGASDALSCADNVQFELGSGDFTMEAFVRFLDTPSSSNSAVIFNKWREGTNERSYRLFLGGASVNNGHLEFQVSTDGTAGTVQSLVSAEFTPIKDHWYHIVVQRISGVLSLLVDGVPLAAPVADANTYHDNASLFMLGGGQNTSTTVLSGTSLNGFLEEVRITKGVGRYNASGFVPPSSAFGRNVGADPDFASVSLLLGFDTAIIDESPFARAVTALGHAARYAPDDAAPGDYKTVNQAFPRDDTGVEAPYIAASNVLTLTANFANGETVSVDGTTYTMESVFSDTADSVLIGADANESIDNLVAAINGDAGEGTLYGTGTTASANTSANNIDNDQLKVSADTPGTAGNAIVIGETAANASWASGATTLVGGLDIPGPSSFFLTRLPPQTTGVKALSLVGRMRKSDSGPAKVQMAFVTADDSSANGVEHSITTSDAFYGDIIEEDPSTTNALAPASFIGARIRVDRTE